MKKFVIFLLLCTVFFGIQCSKKPNEHTQKTDIKSVQITNASTFYLSETEDNWYYHKIHNEDTVVQLIDKQKLPFKKLALFSSASIGYLQALNALENIEVVYNSDWIYSPKVHQLLNEKKIVDGGNAASANLETILATQPDAVIAFSDPNHSKLLESVINNGIPVIYVDEFLERTPLGKAEFLKLYGILIGKKETSDVLFDTIATQYNELRNKALQQPSKPTVFADIMRGDIWYMPGGESFAAQYFFDAGADNLWKDSQQSGAMNLNFEQVFKKANHADFWLNAADFVTLNQLADAYKNHTWFDAFTSGNVYSIAGRTNETGANDYFETGNVRADWVLKDLISIFHPDVLPHHQLYFYHKLRQ